MFAEKKTHKRKITVIRMKVSQTWNKLRDDTLTTDKILQKKTNNIYKMKKPQLKKNMRIRRLEGITQFKRGVL